VEEGEGGWSVEQKEGKRRAAGREEREGCDTTGQEKRRRWRSVEIIIIFEGKNSGNLGGVWECKWKEEEPIG
jgi:hypothetical protein